MSSELRVRARAHSVPGAIALALACGEPRAPCGARGGLRCACWLSRSRLFVLSLSLAPAPRSLLRSHLALALSLSRSLARSLVTLALPRLLTRRAAATAA
eukprot:3881891-Prymnesium_polylepis.1